MGAFINMSKSLDYGSRLTQQEYQRKIAELYLNSSSVSAEDRKQAIRRRELDLTIDHRLGCDFPKERRDALWAIQEQVEKRRFRLAFKYLFRRFFVKRVERDAQGLAHFLVEEYAKVLTPEELQQYFNLRPGEPPVLPIDVDQLKK
jgi:hypothetical protein